mgnify:FL=1
MKRNNYFYKDNQGKNIILSITSTYIELQAPDGYFYFLGKFDNEIQELARKVIPNEIGKLIQKQKKIATGMLERIGKENFPFEKVILKADNKEEMLKIMETLKKAKWFEKLEIIMAHIEEHLTYLRKKEKDNSYGSELQLFDDESKYFDVISDKNESNIYSEEIEIFRKIEGILG